MIQDREPHPTGGWSKGGTFVLAGGDAGWPFLVGAAVVSRSGSGHCAPPGRRLALLPRPVFPGERRLMLGMAPSAA